MNQLPDDDRVRRYREASALIDERPSTAARAAILAAAARAVEARPQDAARPTPIDARRRFRFPLAAAAAIMLSTLAVMLATRTEREQPRFDEPTAATIAPMQLPATVQNEVKPTEAPAGIEEERAPASVAPKKEKADGATPARDSARRSEPMQLREEAAPKPMERGLAEQRSAESDSSGVASAPASTPATPAAKLAAPAAPPAAAPPASASVPPQSADAAGEAEGRLRKDERQRTANDKAEAAPSAARIAGNSAPQAKTEIDAAAWLDKIIALRAKGDDVEADAELKRFRERYPEVVVPLQALARPGTR